MQYFVLIISHRSECFGDVFDKFVISVDLDEIFGAKWGFEFDENFLGCFGSNSWDRLKKCDIECLYSMGYFRAIDMCDLKRDFRSYSLYFEHIQKSIFLTVSIECKIFDWFAMIVDDRMKKECSLFLCSFITYLDTNICIGDIFIWSIWNTLSYNKMKHYLWGEWIIKEQSNTMKNDL